VVLVTHPRHPAGPPRPITKVAFHQSTGAVWSGDLGSAVGHDPVTVRVPGFQVSPPTAPTNVRVNNDSGQPLFVYWGSSWSEGATVTGYTVTAQPGGHTVTVAADNSSMTSTNFPALRDGTYTFSVVAHSAAGSSAAGVTEPLRVIGVPDPPPSVTAVRSLAPHEVTVNWAPVTTTAITGYRVTLSNGANRVVPPGITWAALPAGDGQTVTATVVALNQWLESSPVTSLPVTMPAFVVFTPPTLPTQTATPPPSPAVPAYTGRVAKPRVVVKGARVTVSWAAPTDGRLPITKYQVVRRPGKALTVPSSKRRVVIKGLGKGVHRFAVIAYSAVGAGTTSKYVKVRIP
jgi:hypothetical protein